MKNFLWKAAGFILLGFAYIGVITPGIPFSIFIVGAAYCFSKSSPAMHDWIYNHKLFGPFITNWTHYKVFPKIAKLSMIAMMISSLLIMWFSTYNEKAILYASITMLLVVIWGWRYPASREEHELRVKTNKRIGWFR
jgi:uncharacterized membrane protein YbaN (DUF454 family)